MSKQKTGKTLSCKFCNKEVYIPKNRLQTFTYCSLSCKAKAGLKQITTTCSVCNTEFNHISSRCNTAKYCSRKCYYKAMNTKGSIDSKCLHCGNTFKISPSEVKYRKYCSKKCVNKASLEIWSPAFTTVRKQMASRDMINSCNRCGYSEHKHILGVHHKDRNRKNNHIDNLEILCPICHSLEHKKHISH